MVFTDAEVSEIAVTALGRISVEMFQPGDGTQNLSFGTSDFDYLVMRDGKPIGYGELANLYSEAIDAEIAERRKEQAHG